MTVTHDDVARSTVDPETSWVDVPTKDVISGDPQARVHWLRTTGSGDNTLLAGIFTAEPSRFHYEFSGDETLHVLAGEVRYTLHGSEDEAVMRPGDVLSFPRGTRSIWEVVTPLKKFFVISG